MKIQPASVQLNQRCVRFYQQTNACQPYSRKGLPLMQSLARPSAVHFGKVNWRTLFWPDPYEGVWQVSPLSKPSDDFIKTVQEDVKTILDKDFPRSVKKRLLRKKDPINRLVVHLAKERSALLFNQDGEAVEHIHQWFPTRWPSSEFEKHIEEASDFFKGYIKSVRKNLLEGETLNPQEQDILIKLFTSNYRSQADHGAGVAILSDFLKSLLTMNKTPSMPDVRRAFRQYKSDVEISKFLNYPEVMPFQLDHSRILLMHEAQNERRSKKYKYAHQGVMRYNLARMVDAMGRDYTANKQAFSRQPAFRKAVLEDLVNIRGRFGDFTLEWGEAPNEQGSFSVRQVYRHGPSDVDSSLSVFLFSHYVPLTQYDDTRYRNLFAELYAIKHGGQGSWCEAYEFGMFENSRQFIKNHVDPLLSA